MIHFHGTPITPVSAYEHLVSRNFLVSWLYPQQLSDVKEVAASYVADNGAFSAWRSGKPVTDWSGYYRWVDEQLRVPNFRWAVIPDVIDGGESQNDALVTEWPHGTRGVPVWHMHESISRFERLCHEWPTVAIGSSGEYETPGTPDWWQKMARSMDAVCVDGVPRCGLHLLRGLSTSIFPYLPLQSADSAQIGVNVGLDANFPGRYAPRDKGKRARAIADYIESFQAAKRWVGIPLQSGLFQEIA